MAGKKTYAEEYLISIIPELDTDKFTKERKKVKKEIEKLSKETEKEEKKQNKEKKENDGSKNKQSNKLKNSANYIKTLVDGGDAFNTSISAVAGSFAIALVAVKAIYEVMQSIVNEATEFSNSMITSSSAFVDSDTRSLMAQFGVSGSTATGLESVMDLMGVSTSDLQYMTSGQLELFSTLMDQWESGMSAIDSNDLETFQDVWQGFQSDMASAKLEMQIQLYQMLVDLAPILEYALDGIVDFVETMVDIITSPAVKSALTVISGAVGLILDIVNFIAKIISWVFGNYDTFSTSSDSGSSSTTYVSVDASSVNSYTGDSASMYSLATSTQQDSVNYISNELNQTGSA